MHIAVCAPKKDQEIIRAGIDSFGAASNCTLELDEFCEGSDLLYRQRENRFDVVIVALPGAQGMEIASSVRAFDEKLPLIWISDDAGFGVMSYRLQARMFLVEPITESQVCNALSRCIMVC